MTKPTSAELRTAAHDAITPVRGGDKPSAAWFRVVTVKLLAQFYDDRPDNYRQEYARFRAALVSAWEGKPARGQGDKSRITGRPKKQESVK